MKAEDLPKVSEQLFKKMESDGYSGKVIADAQWILTHFSNYCVSQDADDTGIA